ncbi:hypothetical protein ACLBWZ_00480 [Brucellaceae bacterium C25G]
MFMAGVIATPSAAFAACMQNQAVYTDRDDNYTLTFRPEEPNDLKFSPAPTNEFTITSNETPEFKLTGLVVWPDEAVKRPLAMIMYNCAPDGGSSEDLEDCSIWQGVVYALKEVAEVEPLPKAEEPAAQTVLFPDLLGALDTYDFGAATPAKPLAWEAFRFKTCTQETE